MSLAARFRGRPAVAANIKFGQLMAESEEDAAERVGRLEKSRAFQRLVSTGVVTIEPYTAARFAVRRFAGYGLRMGAAPSEDIGGDSEEVRLMLRIGRDRFEDVFLHDESLSDAERAASCEISPQEARLLREFVDRLYIQGEFSGPVDAGAPARVYSSVAGVAIEEGKASLAFFNREVWKSRYRVDEARRALVLAALRPREACRAEALLRQLELIERRKSTLFRLLEIILVEQCDYFVSRDRDHRRPLVQRAVAARLGVCPSVLNRMISNKAIETPWGVDIPLRELFPDRKEILRAHALDLKAEFPALNDIGIRDEIQRRFGVTLSRCSINQYLKPNRPLAPDRVRTLETCGAEV